MQSDNEDKFGREVLAAAMENPTVVSQWVAAFNAHDLERIVELYAEEAELFDTGMKRVRKGRAQIEGWFSRRFRSMPDLQYTPTRRFLGEGQAAVCWIAHGQTPALLGQTWLKRPFQVDGVSIFVVSEGQIQWQHGYYDHLSIVEQVLPPLKWLPFRL